MKLAPTTILLAGALSACLPHPRCSEFVEFISADSLASALGSTRGLIESDVLLWERDTPSGKGKLVATIPRGSRALVIDEGPEDYEVQVDGVHAWVWKMEVSGAIFLDRTTFRPCTPTGNP